MITSNTNKAGPFVGNASATSFSFTGIKVNSANRLVVIKRNSDDSESTLVKDTDYTVSLNSDQEASPGGSITYPISGTALAANEYLTILHEVDEVQESDITNMGGFYPDVVENMADRNTMMAQKNKERGQRSLRLSRGASDSQIASMEIAASVKDKILTIGATGLLELASAISSVDTLSRSVIGQFLNPRTQGEIDEGITPTDYGYVAGHLYRYGTNTTPGTTDMLGALNAAIDSGHPLIVDFDDDLRISDGIIFARNDLTVKWTGEAKIVPDTGVLVAVTIGGTSNPARMDINGLRVDRTTYSGATENIGILWLENTQCTFTDVESRFSKYNHKFAPTTTGLDYSLFLNLQGIGGFYNFWGAPTSNGYVNENDFIGGRGFCTANTDTNFRMDGSGLGTGHNRIQMSLEGQGVQAIYDNGNANAWHQCRTEGTWSSGSGHVYGPNCIYPLIESSRNDYTIDRSAATDPRDQVISYRAGSRLFTANNDRQTMTLTNHASARGTALEMVNNRANPDTYAWRAINTAAAIASGAHDGSDGAAGLTDSGESWTTNEFIGDIIYNEVDGSYGIVSANTATTITATLADGTDNDWDIGDTFSVYEFNGTLQSNGNMKIRAGFGMHGETPPAQAAHIDNPSGGGTVDTEARTAINAILVSIENIGITGKS